MKGTTLQSHCVSTLAKNFFKQADRKLAAAEVSARTVYGEPNLQERCEFQKSVAFARIRKLNKNSKLRRNLAIRFTEIID
jgi:hypothetical protein